MTTHPGGLKKTPPLCFDHFQEPVEDSHKGSSCPSVLHFVPRLSVEGRPQGRRKGSHHEGLSLHNYPNMAGFFITFEGIDFCGKTTQAKRLASYLKKKGHDVVLIREPGGERISEKIRKILLSEKNKEMTHTTELLLYLASRAQLTERIILPSLKQKKTVICDRYSDSTLAYQGYGRGLNKNMIRNLNRVASSGLSPDLTILLDVPIEISLKRKAKEKKNKGGDRLEKEKFEFHQRIRDGYLKIAQKNKKRIKIIDGRKDQEKTWQKVKGEINSVLKSSCWGWG
jgi:dTMP kinase